MIGLHVIVWALFAIVLCCLALSGWAVRQLKEATVIYMYSRNAEENLRAELTEARDKCDEALRELDKAKFERGVAVEKCKMASEYRDKLHDELNQAEGVIKRMIEIGTASVPDPSPEPGSD